MELLGGKIGVGGGKKGGGGLLGTHNRNSGCQIPQAPVSPMLSAHPSSQ